MKQIMPIFLILLSANSFGQCKTAYGNRSSCPTFNDSLEIYKNTLEVLKFYEKNPAYQKIRTVAIRSEKERKELFDKLQNARRLFFLVRQQGRQGDTSSAIKRPTDISYSEYFKYINEHRFQQRELENQIINHHSPHPLYDTRICPLVVNEYKCIDENNEYIGDLVNIPLYVPLMVKPSKLLTEKERESKELIARKLEANELDNLFEDINIDSETTESSKPFSPNKRQIIATNENPEPNKVIFTAQLEKNNEQKKNTEPSKPTEPVSPVMSAFVFDDRFANPIYYYNQHGSGSIIGFSIKQYFRKLKPDEYDTYVLPKSAREFLSDEDRIQRWLKSRYGNYYTFFL